MPPRELFPAGGESCLTADGLKPAHTWSDWAVSSLSSPRGGTFYRRECAGCGSEQTRRADYVPGAAS